MPWSSPGPSPRTARWSDTPACKQGILLLTDHAPAERHMPGKPYRLSRADICAAVEPDAQTIPCKPLYLLECCAITSGVYRKRTVKAPMEPARAANMSAVDGSACDCDTGQRSVGSSGHACGSKPSLMHNRLRKPPVCSAYAQVHSATRDGNRLAWSARMAPPLITSPAAMGVFRPSSSTAIPATIRPGTSGEAQPRSYYTA